MHYSCKRDAPHGFLLTVILLCAGLPGCERQDVVPDGPVRDGRLVEGRDEAPAPGETPPSRRSRFSWSGF